MFYDHTGNEMSKGAKRHNHMITREFVDQASEVVPVFRGIDGISKKISRRFSALYQLTLMAMDLFAVCLSLFIGFALIHLNGTPLDRDETFATILILSFTFIGFFPIYHLYNYHHIFLKRRHFVILAKAFFWGLLTLGIVVTLFNYPQFLKGQLSFVALFVVAIVFMLLSRFFWPYLTHIIMAMGISFLAMGVMGFIGSMETHVFAYEWPRLLGGIALSAFLVGLGRYFLVHIVFSRWMRRHFRKKLAIVGSDQEAQKITSYIVNLDAPFWVAGFVSAEDNVALNIPVPKTRLGDLNDLPSLVDREKLDEIIVTDEEIDKGTLISLLDFCISEGITVWFPPKLMPIIDMKLYIDTFCGLSLIRLCSQKHSWVFNKVKNAFDALAALASSIILLPFFLIVGVLIKLDSRGPVFYRAKAVGKDGRTFFMYKFRSMETDTDSKIHKAYVTRLIKGEIHPDGKGGQPLKVTKDPRVTSVGKWLRKSSLDELPQILNVLKGEMSFVGPRPCLPYEFEIYQDWHKHRTSIRPGITGLWQVAGRSEVAFEDMVLLDLYYLYNRNFIMDMNILFETLFAVVERRGAY
jgi:exopolysaccharide biosynthesis polyprenyl glycosylphosphotransferase